MNKFVSKIAVALAAFCVPVMMHGAVNGYECMDRGYVATIQPSAYGNIVNSTRGTDIYLEQNGSLRLLYQGPGAGMYNTISPDGKTVGFKSFNERGDQAPALLDIATGKVTLLDNYIGQCGQPAFGPDGMIAYAMDNRLVVKTGADRREYNLGCVINIVTISPDGKWASYADVYGNLYLMNLASGITQNLDKTGGYRAIWSPDGATLAVQRVNGTMYLNNLDNGLRAELGEAASPSWSEDGTLYFTRANRVDDLTVSGGSVYNVNADGSGLRALVENSESCPVAVSVNGRELTVSYATGANYGLEKRVSAAPGMAAMAIAKPVQMLTLDAKKGFGAYVNTDFGHHRPGINEEPLEDQTSMRAPAKMQLAGGSIGLLDIPYINQVWDTPPSHDGTYNYGYVCCAPSSSCMMLGYYGKLDPHGVASRSSAAAVKTCLYSWYVGRDYTSKTGYNFNLRAYGNGSTSVGGGYGYMWYNGNSPAGRMHNFHLNNGAKSSSFNSTYATLVSECGANRPFIICLQNGTGGHVVCVFRGNQQAYNDGSGAKAVTGGIVCHDPYGDYNGSSYPNWDGRYSSYDMPGYNNGRKNIGAFYWGCMTTCEPAVGISSNPTKWDFTLTEGNPAVYKDFVITGKGLTSAITASLSNTTGYSLSYPSALTADGGTVRVTYNPTAKGSTSTVLTLASGSTKTTVNITGNCTPKPLTFVEGWTRSEKSGKAKSDKWDATLVRNLAYYKGKLYMVYNHTDILVVDAHNPDNVLGTLKKGDIVKGGTLTLCDVRVFDGKIIACNLAVKANGEALRVYAWDDDNAEPKLVLNTTNFENADRLGDAIGTKGDWTSGAFYFGRCTNNATNGATRILSYDVTNGVATENYGLVRVDAPGPVQFNCGGSMRVLPDGTGYWVTGAAANVWHGPNATNKATEVNVEMTQTATPWGNDIRTFNWDGSSYAFLTDYKTQAEAGNTYLGGKMQLVRYDGAWSSGAKLGAYPADGLSDTKRNTNCASSIAVATTTGKAAEAWIVCQQQGVAYFINEGGTAPTWDLKPIGEETPPTPGTPTLNASVSSLNMSAQTGASDTKTLTVSGSELSADIDVTVTGTDASLFDVTPTSLDKDGGNITVTFRPTSAGTFKANVVLSSEGAASVTIPVSGIAANKVTYADALGELELVWNFSTNAGNLGSAPWFTQYHTNTTTPSYPRGMAVIGDNLYVLISRAFGSAETDVIVQLNANTGALKKTINCTGVTGGQFSHGSIAALGDKLILSNQARPTDALKVYEINPETGAATVILNDASHGGVNVGDHVTVYGDATNGRIAFHGVDANSANPKVVWYQVTNGTVNATAKTIAAESGTIRSAGTVNFDSDGTFWLNSRSSHPSHFKADGTLIKTITTGSALQYGTGSALVNYGSNKYLAVATPDGTSGSYGNVAMYLMKVTDGAANATLEGTYPAGGLGTGSWSAANVTALTARLTGENNSKADFYVLAATQGIAHYTYNGKSSAVESLEADDTHAPVEFYTLQGIRVDSDNLAPGLYIRRQGKKAAKILVR